jgi:pectate lyase
LTTLTRGTRIVAALALVAGLAACGGGSDGPESALDASADVAAIDTNEEALTMPACSTASGTGAKYVGTGIGAQTGAFDIEWDATPSASPMDASVGLSDGLATSGWNNLAAIVRFNTAGTIDVRNGNAYGAAITLRYAAGQTYRIRASVDVPAKRYTITVTPPGSAPQVIATNYAFRAEQASVTKLDHAVTAAYQGSLQACVVSVRNAVAVSASPAALAFGDVRVGSTGSQTLAIRNAGSRTVTVSAITATGTGIAVSGLPTPATLQPGESRNLTVTFTPAAAGSLTGRLTISSDAPDSPLGVAVTGNGVSTTSPTPTPTPTPPPPGVVPAFPGAEGGGALSKGGRGGAVIEVTNLNDSGTGSLRACVQASGPRTCVFRVGGTIQLASSIRISSPYLTVAGETAPGGGIQLSGRNMASQMIGVYTHDVTWRYTRIRKGYNASAVSQSGQVVALREGAYNVIFDHNSIAWTQDENITIWSDTAAPRASTFSWNIVAEPLADHPTSIITGSNVKAISGAISDIDFVKNYVPNTSHRNPLIKTKKTRIVNNIFYNYSYYATQFGGGSSGDIIGNLYKPGPLTPSGKHEIQAYPSGNASTADGTMSLYVANNVGPYNSVPSNDNWSTMVRLVSGENGSESGMLAHGYHRTSALAPVGVAISAYPATDLEGLLLPTVGASRRLDCSGNWVSTRDAVDVRLVNDIKNRTGKFPARETEVGGFPTLAAGTACPDADRDGMPDAWEAAQGLNPGNAGDRNVVGAGGYTNLERYLHGK